MIQQAIERIKPLIPPSRILVVLGREHVGVAREQLAEIAPENFLIEPVGKDTAPGIGFALLHLEKMAPDAFMVVLPADHYIQDQKNFLDSLSAAIRLLEFREEIIALGIRPTRPETSYGYIEAGEEIDSIAGVPFLKVGRFVEKPDLESAKRYIADENYYWNSGIFIWRNSTIQALLKRCLPDVWRGLARIRVNVDDNKVVTEVFGAVTEGFH